MIAVQELLLRRCGLLTSLHRCIDTTAAPSQESLKSALSWPFVMCNGQLHAQLLDSWPGSCLGWAKVIAPCQCMLHSSEGLHDAAVDIIKN